MYTAVFNNTAYSYNWWRSYNATGWYNETYGGGIWMSDSTYVRTYNGKSFLVDSAAHIRIGTGEANEKSLHFHNDARYLYFFQQSVAAGSNFGLWDATGSFTRWLSDTSGNFYNYVSIRAPIFYDTDNTGYFCNPNGLSYFSTLQVLTETQYPGSMNSDWASGYYHFGPTNDTPNGQYGHGRVQRLDGNWTIQEFWTTADNTGYWWRQKLNGTWGAWLRVLWDGATYKTINWLYSNIIYDSDNTSYYIDPNNYSQFAGIYTNNWFRAQNQTGLYSESYGQHIYPTTDGRLWNFTTSNQTSGGLRILKSYEGEVRGYLYWDSTENFGLLHKNGGWNYRGWTDGFEAYGYWHYQTHIQAYIYYDRDDTNYYSDPNGGSRFNTLSMNGLLVTAANTTAFIGANDTTLSVRGTSTTSACMSFHRPGNYAINVGLDTDNYFSIGGWSASIIRHRFAMDGNYWSGLWSDWVSTQWRSPIFYDYHDTSYYCDPNGQSHFYQLNVYGNQIILQGGSPTIFFNDVDEQCAVLHNNSSLLYILRKDSYGAGWSTVGSGNWPMVCYLYSNDFVFGGAISSIYGMYEYASDRRLKDNVIEISNAIDKIKQIRGVTFSWNAKADEVGFKPDIRDDVGVIAQEIQAVLPQAVHMAPFDTWSPSPDEKMTADEVKEKRKESKSGENYLTVQMEKIVPLLIQAIKEQQIQIENLQSRLDQINPR
jgi:hypothetical protein